MAGNIEQGKATDPQIGVELGKTLPEDSLPKVEVRREKVPIANIERFHLNYQSLRDVQYAIQITVVFIVCALVGFTSNYASALTAADCQYLIPIMGTLMIADTFGATLFMVKKLLNNNFIFIIIFFDIPLITKLLIVFIPITSNNMCFYIGFGVYLYFRHRCIDHGFVSSTWNGI